ncbi:hypothetical protein KDA_05460 [Dictyobacter alpinus]|uniref:BclA C-terminal domain-containing protein n=1 Tax=Dictyobacter alpinus TaxID=2014873 RepID=A0A402B146_9CHLR|nr:hypothetical protein KDA_05460 [Dictyobacter alpinus]
MIVGAITHTPGSSSITVGDTGTYRIDFNIQTAQPSQFTIFRNGVPLPGTGFGSFGGSQITHGDTIQELTAGDVLEVVNHTSLNDVQLQINAGGNDPVVNASFNIIRIS